MHTSVSLQGGVFDFFNWLHECVPAERCVWFCYLMTQVCPCTGVFDYVTWWHECVPAEWYVWFCYLMTRVCPCKEVWMSPEPFLHEYRSTRWLLWTQIQSHIFCCYYLCVFLSSNPAKLTEAAKMWDSDLWGFHWTVPTSHLLCRLIFLGGSEGASRFTMYRKRRLRTQLKCQYLLQQDICPGSSCPGHYYHFSDHFELVFKDLKQHVNTMTERWSIRCSFPLYVQTQ